MSDTPGYPPPQGTQPPYQEVPPPYQQTTPPTGYPQQPVAAGGLASNVAAGIAYVTFIPAVIFLALAPYNRDPLVRFHSFQSIFLTVASIVLHFGIGFVLHIIPIIGGIMALMLSMIVSLAIMVVWLIAIVQAFQGKYWKIPFIGDLAAQQASSASLT